MLKIEECNNSNPHAFWHYIKRLGPTKKEEIPWEIEVDGEIVREKDKVLEKWMETFRDLYTCNEIEYDDNFKETLLSEKNSPIRG